MKRYYKNQIRTYEEYRYPSRWIPYIVVNLFVSMLFFYFLVISSAHIVFVGLFIMFGIAPIAIIFYEMFKMLYWYEVRCGKYIDPKVEKAIRINKFKLKEKMMER